MKMNCKETKIFFEERIRMCKEYNQNIGCYGCPFSSGEEVFCEQMLWEEPETAIDMMQKWSDDHPKESIEEHFSKLLPHMGFDSYMSCCCRSLDGRINTPDWCECCDYTEASCERCWNRPYEESMKGDK